jgi:hypothetical protein
MIGVMNPDPGEYLMDLHWGNVREFGVFPFAWRKVKCCESVGQVIE